MKGIRIIVVTAIATAAFLAAYGFSGPVSATVQFKKDTGKECSYCHDGSPKDGKLTPKGQCFKDNGNKLDKCGD